MNRITLYSAYYPSPSETLPEGENAQLTTLGVQTNYTGPLFRSGDLLFNRNIIIKRLEWWIQYEFSGNAGIAMDYPGLNIQMVLSKQQGFKTDNLPAPNEDFKGNIINSKPESNIRSENKNIIAYVNFWPKKDEIIGDTGFGTFKRIWQNDQLFYDDINIGENIYINWRVQNYVDQGRFARFIHYITLDYEIKGV